MTSSEIKVKTNNQDILKKTIRSRERLNRSQSNQASLLTSPLTKKNHLHAADIVLNCAHNSPLTLKYKR